MLSCNINCIVDYDIFLNNREGVTNQTSSVKMKIQTERIRNASSAYAVRICLAPYMNSKIAGMKTIDNFV